MTKMRFICIFYWVIVGVLSSFANDTIYYRLPAKVEAELAEDIQRYRLSNNNENQIAIFLGRYGVIDGILEFYVDDIPYNPDNDRKLDTQVAINTHRYLRIGNEVFPIFLKDDERLGSPTPKSLRGNIFDRECKIIKQISIFDNPIYFKLGEEKIGE